MPWIVPVAWAIRLLDIELVFGAEDGAGAGLGVSELIWGACSEDPPPPPPQELIKKLKK